MKLVIETKELDPKHFISLGINEDQSAFCTITPETDFATAMQMLHTLSLHMLNAYTIAAAKTDDPKTDEELKTYTAVKEQVYDAYNLAVSSVLELFAPEFELRPDVTADAIAKVESDIVKEKYSHLTREEKRQANKKLNAIKKELLKDNANAKLKLQAQAGDPVEMSKM